MGAAIGKRLRPKIPFVLGGKHRAESLWASDAVEAMRFCASIARQLRGQPDGAKVRLVVTHDVNTRLNSSGS